MLDDRVLEVGLGRFSVSTVSGFPVSGFVAFRRIRQEVLDRVSVRLFAQIVLEVKKLNVNATISNHHILYWEMMFLETGNSGSVIGVTGSFMFYENLVFQTVSGLLVVSDYSLPLLNFL